ncbi:hypothetical protein [Okeania sp. SIO3B5]|nr:hypothetical protein [Okeania sp. SIO3B5]
MSNSYCSADSRKIAIAIIDILIYWTIVIALLIKYQSFYSL